MSRIETSALTAVIDGAKVGGYTLPTELTDAWRTRQRLRTTTIELPPGADVETVAARVVAAAAGGADVDVLEQARALDEGLAARQHADRAQGILSRAIEQADDAATDLASNLTETIITKHLAPAMAELLEEARKVAADLAGQPLSAHELLKAPTKVRNAYLRLPEMVERHRALLDARRRTNVVGHRQARHDVRDLFATFENPMAFFPRWKPPAQIPRLPFPEEPQMSLLWLASDSAAQAAGPWLPTIEQQDAAWWGRFGEAQQRQAANHVAARAQAGASV